MGTVRRLDDHRGIAVRRFRNGERARSIAVSLGRSVRWVYKWAGYGGDTSCRLTPVRRYGYPPCTAYSNTSCDAARNG